MFRTNSALRACEPLYNANRDMLSEHAASCTEALYECPVTQTYEGGLGGEPGNEAHGGYTYCGLAALMLADSAHVLHLPRLLHWAVHCQARRSMLRVGTWCMVATGVKVRMRAMES